MIFLETSIFTRRVTAILSDDEYRELQAALMTRPDAGVVIPGSGGILCKKRKRQLDAGTTQNAHSLPDKLRDSLSFRATARNLPTRAPDFSPLRGSK